MNRRKAAINVATSLAYQVIAILYGFIVPRIILTTFGSEVNGLISSLGQILNFITLLEGGVLGVVMAALYKPLAEKDDQKVSAIIKATDGFFKKIAFTFVFYAAAVSILYPLFVKTSFSWGYVCSLSLIISISLFVQYFFSLTYRTLINADQKGYVVFVTQIIFSLVNLTLTILVAKLYPEIHVLKLFTAIAHFIQPIVFSNYVRKHYEIDHTAAPDEQALSQRWDGFGQNIAYFIHVNTDVVVLTVFSTLENVSVYAVYFMIANALKTLVMSISSALVPSMGNVLVSADDATKQKTFDLYEFGICAVTTFSFVCGALLVTPFVSVYTAGVNDADYFQPVFGWLLMLAEALYCFRDPFVSIAYASGHFKQTAKYAYIEAGMNIAISVVLVWQLGLIGVAIGTAVSMLYRMVAHVFYLRKTILMRPIRKWLRSAAAFSLAAAAAVLLRSCLPAVAVNGYWSWFASACLTAVVVLAAMGVILYFFYRDLTRQFISRIMSRIRRKHSA